MHNEPPFRAPSRPSSEGASYRLYFLNSFGHINLSHEFITWDDDEAVRIAEGLREGRRMELWQRTRFVKRWNADVENQDVGGS